MFKALRLFRHLTPSTFKVPLYTSLYTLNSFSFANYQQPVTTDTQLKEQIKKELKSPQSSGVSKRKKRQGPPKLPQTQDLNEILDYYTKNKGTLGTPHFMIIMSRLAHLKGQKVDATHPTMLQIINEITRLRLHKDAHKLANFIKYTSMAGIQDRNIWKKYVRSLKKVDFNGQPQYFAYTINYLSKANVRDKALWEGLQDEAVKVLDASKENNSYTFSELFLNAFGNKTVKPELQERLINRMKKHIPFEELEHLKRLATFAWRYSFKDEELWDFLKKWSIYRLERATDEQEIQTTLPYISFCFGKGVANNLFPYGDEKTQQFFNDFSKIFHSKRNLCEQNTKEATYAYSGMLALSYRLRKYDEKLQQAFDEYFGKNHQSFAPKEMAQILRTLPLEEQFTYLNVENIKRVQEFIATRNAELDLDDYQFVLELVNSYPRFDAAEKDRLFKALLPSVDLFIQTNPKKVDLNEKVIKLFEEKKYLSAEDAQQKRMLLNIPKF